MAQTRTINHSSKPPVLRIIQRQNHIPIEKIGRRRVRIPFTDLFHWLMNRSWLELILLILVAFIGTNVVFALIYYALPNAISNTHGQFINYFFFSVQTMATIGYGIMAPQSLTANLFVALEAFFGLLGFAVASGVMFGRLARPTAKIMFSNVGVVSTRDGRRVFTARLANERDNQILEGNITMTYITNTVTKEGETLRRFFDMKLERSHTPIFTLTWTVIHPIDAESPLNNKTEDDLVNEQTEILITFRGVDETFSQEIFARNSYIAEEIQWQRRFVDILSVNQRGIRTINYEKFHDTQPWQ